MSVSFYIVNAEKRQFLNPNLFGDFSGTSGYLNGHHAVALAMLTCDADALGMTHLAGSWVGNQVFVTTDAAQPNQSGIPTATEDEPDRNLYMMAWQEFRDISYEAIAMVCDRLPDFADSLARNAKFDIDNESGEFLKTLKLWHIVNAISVTNCSPLRHALERHLGQNWEIKHRSGLLQHNNRKINYGD